jgi:5-methylphenazine-1-carboxylate 1-monooxygenase
MRAIIIGAGIGGCAAALSLHRRGIDVTVYESVREIEPLGVGINLLPHAMQVLDDLDIAQTLIPLGVPTAELVFFNRHGQLIWREPRGLAAGYDVPQLSVHRGKLQLALVNAVIERIGRDNVRTGHALRTFTPGSVADRPTVELEQRLTGETITETADVVIACDGIHSVVRQTFNPNQGPPHWSGNILWRAATRHRGFLTKRSMFMAGHLPHKFVAYPITEPDADGLQTVNWIAELNRESEGLGGREGWNKKVDKSLFADRFADWKFEWLDIPELIAAADEVYEFPMVDRDPLNTWTYGRVTLLGDAAHPMYPIGSNGASQAILDSAALASALNEHADPCDALRAYESVRRPMTAKIVMSNRVHGPERVLDLAEQRAPGGFTDITTVFAPNELEDISAQYKQVAGFSRPKN